MRHPLSLALVFGVLFGGLRAASAQTPATQTPATINEPAGGFSYMVPKGWTINTYRGMKYHIAATNPVDGFAPNVNVTDEAYPGSIADYAKHSIELGTKLLPSFKLLSQSDFVTASGTKGVRLAANVTVKAHKVHEVFYLFPGKGNRKYLATFGSAQSQNGKLDPVVDASMRTFKLL